MRHSAATVGVVVVACALGGQIGGVRAQTTERRIALVDRGEELADAVRIALEPWSVTFVIVTDQSPGPTAPMANQLARELALHHGAGAAVWISQHERGYALWIYDVASNHAVSRRLTTPPPFDAPAAAAVALSVKTLLRHSASAPEGERYGALPVPEPEAALPLSEVPHEGELAATSERTQPSPARAQAAAVRASGSARAQREARGSAREQNHERALALHARASVPSQLDFEATAGYRAHFTDQGAGDFRFGVGTSWWPAAAWVGLSVRAAFGPPRAFDKAGFNGELFDTTVGLAGRIRAELPRGVRLLAAAGAAGEFTILRGFKTADPDQDARVPRVIPALTLELGADFLLSSWLRAGLRATGALLIHPPRYRVGGQTTLELTNWNVEGMFVLGACWPS